MKSNNDEIIISNYKILKNEKIGAGSFGHIFKGINIETNEEVAIKIEGKNSYCPQLKHEARLYQIIKGESNYNK